MIVPIKKLEKILGRGDGLIKISKSSNNTFQVLFDGEPVETLVPNNGRVRISSPWSAGVRFLLRTIKK